MAFFVFSPSSLNLSHLFLVVLAVPVAVDVVDVVFVFVDVAVVAKTKDRMIGQVSFLGICRSLGFSTKMSFHPLSSETKGLSSTFFAGHVIFGVTSICVEPTVSKNFRLNCPLYSGASVQNSTQTHVNFRDVFHFCIDFHRRDT